MPKIFFGKRNRSPVQVSSGENLMKELLRNQVPVASSCHGDGICGKCRIEVLAGAETLGGPGEQEAFMIEKLELKKSTRLSCQVQVGTDDLTLDTGYW